MEMNCTSTKFEERGVCGWLPMPGRPITLGGMAGRLPSSGLSCTFLERRGTQLHEVTACSENLGSSSHVRSPSTLCRYLLFPPLEWKPDITDRDLSGDVKLLSTALSSRIFQHQALEQVFRS